MAKSSHLALVFLTASLLSAADPPGISSFPRSERAGIRRLAQLTAKDHSTILFTINDETIGLVKDGAVGRIGRDWIHHCNRLTHPALSHDGRQVAYVADGESEDRPLRSCRIVIHELATGVDRTLIETNDDPGELSWSWDNTRILFFDPPRGLSEVSVANSIAKPISRRTPGRFFAWYPMQWLHNNQDLVVERSEEVPTGAPRTVIEQSMLFTARADGAHLLALGSSPSVSPLSDRIAYFSIDGLAMINPDGSDKQLIARNPRVFFSRADLGGPIVWSPEGGQLFFSAIETEYRSGRLFLVAVKSGKPRTFLSLTSIRIRGWH